MCDTGLPCGRPDCEWTAWTAARLEDVRHELAPDTERAPPPPVMPTPRRLRIRFLANGLARVVLLASAMGCSSADHPRHFVVSAPADALAAVQGAARQWDRCGETTIHVVPDGEPADVRMAQVDVVQDPIQPWLVGQLLARYNAPDHSITYVPTVHTDATIFAHELGHMLGLEHYPQGIMRNPDPEGPVGEGDCSELRAVLAL